MQTIFLWSVKTGTLGQSGVGRHRPAVIAPESSRFQCRCSAWAVASGKNKVISWLGRAIKP
jgi:hypothetical protein